MYSGITTGDELVTDEPTHIDISGSFETGETIMDLSAYKGSPIQKGQIFEIVISSSIAFECKVIENNAWYEQPKIIVTIPEIVVSDLTIVWAPLSTGCTLSLIAKQAGSVSMDWDWKLTQKKSLLNNPIDVLLFVRKAQNWDGVPTINESTTLGGFNHTSLDSIRNIVISRQILNYNDATTKAISKSICEEFNLALYTDNTSKESVIPIDYPDPDTDLSLTLHDIIKEPEILEVDSSKIYCEPTVKFAIDYSKNSATKQFSITNTDQAVYDSSYTPGLTEAQGQALWGMAKDLRTSVRVVTAHEYEFKWVVSVEDAVNLLARKFVWMGKKRMKIIVSYDKGKDYTVCSWGKIKLPLTTANKEIRFVIEEITKAKKRGQNSALVAMQVVLWDTVSEDLIELWQDSFDDTLLDKYQMTTQSLVERGDSGEEDRQLTYRGGN